MDQPPMEMYVAGMIALVFGAAFWPLLARRRADLAGWFSAAVPAGMFFWLLGQVPEAGQGVFASWSADWVPAMGVGIDFLLDGPGLLLSLLVTGIGALILIYGGCYLKGSPQAAPFFCFIHLFMLAMLGVACSDHFIVFFVFWELTSVASYLLIGLGHAQIEARKAALRALVVTGAGGLALLAGLILLGEASGTYRFSELQAQGGAIVEHAKFLPILVLVLLGTFTKSAQFPFHFWLPGAMAAPTPVSAYLHSATMVKAGVFLLAKLYPVFGQTEEWRTTLMIFGSLTMLLGSLLALAQTDLKRLLAYSTMSALGTLVLLLGLGTTLAVEAAMVFLVVHALYKAALFMAAGVVDKATGTRDITRLSGLGAPLPLLAVAAVLAAFSMSGLPPFIGFIGKELLYEAQVSASSYAMLITFAGFAASAVNVAVAFKVGVAPFRRRGEVPKINPKARQLSLLAGPMLLALAGTLAGLFPDLLGRNLLAAAVSDVVGEPVEVKLKLWHGFNMVLALSMVTVAVGWALYAKRERIRPLIVILLERFPARANEIFDAGLQRVLARSEKVTLAIQHGNLRGYIVMMLLSLAALLFVAVFSGGGLGEMEAGPLRMVPVGVGILIMAAAVAAVRSNGRLSAMLAFGVVGFGVAMLYALFGAPDLALTQVLVEALTLGLFAFVLRRMPLIRNHSSKRRRRVDFAVAAAAGAAVTLAMLAALGTKQPPPVSDEMVRMSVPDAYGRNIVNVILVDFRAMDTLGEICVLAIAALGVAGLLLGFGTHNRQADVAVATPIYRAAANWIVPLLIFISVVILLRGHNEPGGGFIGGLLGAAGLVLWRLTRGESVRRPTWWSPLLIGGGLAAAVLSMVPSLLARAPFMQGQWFGEVWLPLAGKVKFGSTFIFDVGVFLVVVGVTQLVLARVLQSSEIDVSKSLGRRS